MFDLTKEIKLQPELKMKYSVARALLYIIFLIIVFDVSYHILFPTVPLDFSISNPTSNKNTLVAPRTSKTGEFLTKGKLAANDTLIDNANPIGQFSKADITIIVKNNAKNIDNIPLKINKAYQAFRYPLGDPIGFKDGSLLTTPDGAYYIVSDGMLHKFSSTDIILKLGYPKSSFSDVRVSDLKYNKLSDDITDTSTYPNGTLFAINESYYQLKDGQLIPFVSVQAFLTQFDPASAIAKNSDFLNTYPVSEALLGFADGTLVSSDISVYILSHGKKYPIRNPETFVSMGFNWNDVIPISQSELNIYEKQKQFTHDDPHPDGTLFLDQKTNSYFVIENGLKRPITSSAIIKTYSKQKPVIADLQGVEKNASCILKKQFLSSDTFKCSVSLKDLTGFVGNDYQIAATFPLNVDLSTINITFSTPMTWGSMRDSLSTIKTKIISKQH